MNIFKNIKARLLICSGIVDCSDSGRATSVIFPDIEGGLKINLIFGDIFETLTKPANGRIILFSRHLSHTYTVVYLSTYLSGVYLPICLIFSINQSVNQSVSLSICLSTPFIPERDPGTKIYSPAALSFSNQIASPPPGLCGSSRAADGTAHPSAFQGVAGNGRSNGGT